MKALALALLLAAPKAAEPWQHVASDEAGRFLLDPDSLRRSGQRVRFRLSFVTDAPRADGVVDEIFEMTIDCRRRHLILGRGVLRRQTRQYPDGTSVAVFTEVRPMRRGPARRQAAPILPGSPQEAVMRRVCA